MYNKEKINKLAERYINTEDEGIFGELLQELIKVIDVQLGKNYASIRENWDDLRQKVYLQLYKHKRKVISTVTKPYSRYYYFRIRDWLNRSIQEIKIKKEKECFDYTGREHGNITIIVFNGNGNAEKIIKQEPNPPYCGINYFPQSLEALNEQKKAILRKQIADMEKE